MFGELIQVGLGGAVGKFCLDQGPHFELTEEFGDGGVVVHGALKNFGRGDDETAAAPVLELAEEFEGAKADLGRKELVGLVHDEDLPLVKTGNDILLFVDVARPCWLVEGAGEELEGAGF